MPRDRVNRSHQLLQQMDEYLSEKPRYVKLKGHRLTVNDVRHDDDDLWKLCELKLSVVCRRLLYDSHNDRVTYLFHDSATSDDRRCGNSVKTVSKRKTKQRSKLKSPTEHEECDLSQDHHQHHHHHQQQQRQEKEQSRQSVATSLSMHHLPNSCSTAGVRKTRKKQVHSDEREWLLEQRGRRQRQSEQLVTLPPVHVPRNLDDTGNHTSTKNRIKTSHVKTSRDKSEKHIQHSDEQEERQPMRARKSSADVTENCDVTRKRDVLDSGKRNSSNTSTFRQVSAGYNDKQRPHNEQQQQQTGTTTTSLVRSDNIIGIIRPPRCTPESTKRQKKKKKKELSVAIQSHDSQQQQQQQQEEKSPEAIVTSQDNNVIEATVNESRAAARLNDDAAGLLSLHENTYFAHRPDSYRFSRLKTWYEHLQSKMANCFTQPTGHTSALQPQPANRVADEHDVKSHHRGVNMVSSSLGYTSQLDVSRLDRQSDKHFSSCRGNKLSQSLLSVNHHHDSSSRSKYRYHDGKSSTSQCHLNRLQHQRSSSSSYHSNRLSQSLLSLHHSPKPQHHHGDYMGVHGGGGGGGLGMSRRTLSSRCLLVTQTTVDETISTSRRPSQFSDEIDSGHVSDGAGASSYNGWILSILRRLKHLDQHQLQQQERKESLKPVINATVNIHEELIKCETIDSVTFNRTHRRMSTSKNVSDIDSANLVVYEFGEMIHFFNTHATLR